MTYYNAPPPVTTVPLGYAMPGTRPILPVRDRAKRAILCFYLMIPAYILATLGEFGVYAYMPADDAEIAPEQAPVLLAIAFILIIVGLALFAVWVLAVVFYCMWQHRVHANAGTISNTTLRFTPGWGVGYWFIPILNLFRPYQVMRDIDDATPADGPRLTDRINLWWIAFIVSIILGVSSSALEDADNATAASLTFSTLQTVVDIGGIFLIVGIMKSLTDRQAAIVGE